MNELAIESVLMQMSAMLTCVQLKRLREVMTTCMSEQPESPLSDKDLLTLFITAKEVEGCSIKTIDYYQTTLEKVSRSLAKPYTQITTDDLRNYLSKYESERGVSKVTIDNVRRIMSSFFSWLEDEDYIVKSPVRRIRKVKSAQIVKETFADEDLETLRDNTTCERDLAIIDLLSSTGMRVGELVKLNRNDVDFHERECLVHGKGNKQRLVYFDARTKLHLQRYLHSRTDTNEALFVSLCAPHQRISIGGIESRLRLIGRRLKMQRVHPHKFRRTLATHAIDKGMPIEQVQKLLGHAKIDTTMHYAMVNQSNVKASHRRYLE